MNMGIQLWRSLSRRKVFGDDVGGSQLARVLDVVDLTALGVGSTLGLGVYVLAGAVAKGEAGPAVTLSFLVAAIASAFAGLCYAEFAARVPKAGSAYVYSYVSVGEFVAFTIGWNLILEYVIGTSSVARGMSGYIDALTDNKMKNALKENLPIEVDFLGEYPDFFSFGIVMLLAVLLSIGVKESTILNNIFTAVNLVTVAIVLIAGSIYSDSNNWKIPKENVPEGAGEGGFLPFGFAGVMAGAAKCFYGFVGFDCVATTGEEAKNPQKSIPLAIVLSLIIIFLAYFGVSTVLTMMWPYYDQDADAPFPYVFDKLGLTAIKWIVTVGAVFALCTSLLGAMFPLPRILYAMSSDGLIFKYLAKVSPKTQTPVRATLLSGLLAAIMATIFDLHQLIDMMSIGTLLAYTIVAICVLILRYQDDSNISNQIEPSTSYLVRQIFNLNSAKFPNNISSGITKIGIVVFSILSIALCVWLKFSPYLLEHYFVVALIIVVVLTAAMVLIVAVIARQPCDPMDLSFKVPLVPLLPCLSVLINLYLMAQLDINTWIRFAVWLFIGYLIYFGYGIRNSNERRKRLEEESKISMKETEATPSAGELTNGTTMATYKSKDTQF